MAPEDLLTHHPREALRFLRGWLGLSQVAFAVTLGVSARTVERWEAGRHRPPARRRDHLAALLGLALRSGDGAALLDSRGEGWAHAVAADAGAPEEEGR